MRLVYLSTSGPDLLLEIESLRQAGYEVIHAYKVEEAETLLKSGHGDVLLYTWPFAGDLRWIKKQFITVVVNPDKRFGDFVRELPQSLPQ